MPNIEIVNMKQVELDFDRYNKKVDIQNKRTLVKFTSLIVSNMKSLLFQRVMRWTGNLSNSITTEITKNQSVIEPKAPYARWIEVGGGSFEGYHYMEESVEKYQDRYTDEIKRNIKV